MAEPFIGEIRQFAGNFAPAGWALCSGQLLSIGQNDALFSLIGTTYGGDGQQTFALPDLRGRVPVHTGSGFAIGQSGGTETVTLVQNQLPVHTHVPAASNKGGSDAPAGNVWGNSATGSPYAATPGTNSMNPSSISTTGGNSPHENRVPFQAVTYIIALEGIYPTQN